MKIFLDCGYYIGKAIEYYAPFMDEDWVVYAFEPYTDLDVEKTSARFPFKVNWVKKAVWTHDGETEFRIGGRNDASHIDTIRTSTDPLKTVECIDFSRFVGELPEGATIVCSMDIEGAEFAVLEKMLAEKTAQRLALLDIEFHHRLMLDRDADDVSRIRRALEGEGVLVKLKVDV